MDNLKDFLQPKLGDETVMLPVTFDYNGGRSESTRTRKVLSWIIGVLGFLFGLLILFSKGRQSFLVKVLIVGILYAVVVFIIRFILLREGRLRKQYYEQLDKDYQLTTEDIWGIYDIEGDDLKIAHYRNGKIGIAFSLEKDVIVGLDSDSEFNHYEAIADAYNEIAKNRASAYHLDYMTHVGKDKRISTLYAQAGKSTNPEMRAVLNGIYSNLEEDMADEISTFDTYFIIMSSTETQPIAIVQKIIKRFLQGNYVGYYPLDEEGLRDLTAELFNLNKFSAVDAERDALISSTLSIAVPISIEKDGVVTKLNKTTEEKRQAAEEQRKLQELVKREARRRKQEQRRSRKNKKVEDVGNNVEDDIVEL